MIGPGIDEVKQVTEVARGISDLGMLAIAGGSFIVIAILMMIAVFTWFKSLINRIIKKDEELMGNLSTKSEEQKELLTDIAESLRPSTLLQIQSIYNTCFDLSVERVCRIIKKVREENHIADRTATKLKIRTLLCNHHEDRNTRFDNIRYRGRSLSHYTAPEWVDWVADVVEREVYSEVANNGRAYTNVKAVYDKIRTDFHHKLNY